MNKRKVIVPIVLVAGAVVGGLYATGRLGNGETTETGLTLYGNVDVRQVELGFRVAGRLAAMKFEEGQAVKAGEEMATLDKRAYEDQLRTAEAQIAVHQATLDKLLAGSRPAEVARARATVQEARAMKDNADTELARTKKLVEGHAIPGASLDTALTASRRADARLAAARETFRLVAQGARVEDVAGARAMLEVAKANVESAKTALADTRLIAPSDGVVTSRVHEPGAIVSPNNIVYVLALTHSVWVRAYVSEVDLGKVAPGTPVTVESDSSPGHPYKGHVGFVSPTAEFTPKSIETAELRTALVYRLRVIVDEVAGTRGGLQQGMPVTVRVGS